ncbi:hypothetical protein TSUD_188200 [Trifolium subterraneum]|uniref:Uncharacterized protein n=1 Tax=Trifolium subterraneum TaxID=3900 RepID=A0A2Z6PJ76_TRISU|nr:hypothetical protein TSUD_188200 [Trifolium subterraneum]
MDETRIDKEYDVGDACFLSDFEFGDSNWFIGWLEPLGYDFESNDNDDEDDFGGDYVEEEGTKQKLRKRSLAVTTMADHSDDLDQLLDSALDDFQTLNLNSSLPRSLSFTLLQ